MIPALPVDETMIDEDGKMTDTYRQFFSDLIQALQTILSDEGIQMAPQTTFNIAQLTDDEHLGRILYDTDLHVLKTNLNGVIKTITTS